MTIHAPFNFVPLSEEVFFPDWADMISHDVPFSDGLSGVITMKMTAKTPIFVRNGHTKDEADRKDENYKSFSQTVDGKYFIPSTSIKGAIRNVMEIMSLGKMSRVSEKRYGVRDLKLDKYIKTFREGQVHCGWMSMNQDEILIEDHDIPRRISHEEIDNHFHTNFCGKFSSDSFNPKSMRSPICKYEMLRGKSLQCRFEEKPLNANNPVDKRIKVNISHNADKSKPGTIVLTGQPSGRKEAEGHKAPSGKFYEFVFLDEIVNAYHFDIEDDLIQDFFFIYKDSDEWLYWQRKLKRGESVPVFFTLFEGKIKHLGLSYLYKLPYPKKVNEYVYEKHRSSQKDLCECIFGYTSSDQSLRGRVQFSNAFCVEANDALPEMDSYMGSPKPTYYPIYLKQEGENGSMEKNGRIVSYKTMFDKEARLKGWKRYPVRKNWQDAFDVPEGQEENTNPFIPLGSGSEFKFQVRFFNLRPEELGAILSAMDLRKDYYHTIGFAKAFGFGQVRLEVESISGDVTLGQKEELKTKYEELMSSVITRYKKSPQISHLEAMMHEQELSIQLKYMKLDDFVSCKKQNDKKGEYGEYLDDYMNYIKPPTPAKPQVVEEEAVVSVISGNIRQAKLVNGKDLKNKCLEMNNKKERLKVGDKILVKVIKNGKILEFKRKL